ncbi:hypothetical protein U5817_18620 [Aromatoleum evansii]|uniref:Uncharacterized protein n=1 Tax=Aromatoleum evansii TaxID=59406 RepID=A0ABZ1AH65_AROEV|nr:hypothetical protein U5817_18620 [Aromatoleum evansii]
MKPRKSFTRTALALAVSSLAVPVLAAETIQFDPDGPGVRTPISVLAFDWTQNSALAVGGNPSGGLMAGDVVHLLAHAKLAKLINSNGVGISLPSGVEITFVAGFAESVTAPAQPGAGPAGFQFDSGSQLPNFFEMWVSTPDHNALAGTGYNNGKRILSGVVTSSIGNYSGGLPIQALDLFGTNNYPGISTITGVGSTQLSGVITSADEDYFPGLTPTQLANLKVFFNTSTVTPYRQINPSAKFVGDGAELDLNLVPPAFVGPVPNVLANIGTTNGGPHGVRDGDPSNDLNFELQADSNQSFEPGVEIPGSCRVTYGGNDKNGNIDLKKFGEICSRDKGNVVSCYTFGGQVGAPTTNPNQGGPFGEHTHHQVQGDAGDFVFRAGTHSAPENTRIDAVACKDPGAIQPAAANASFKQIDFEGTGSFRTLSAQAKEYLEAKGGTDIETDNVSDARYYFRVDMVDTGEPGSGAKEPDKQDCQDFLDADQNFPLATPDPRYLEADGGFAESGASCADVYQFFICPTEASCEEDEAMYAVRGYLTGGNIQLHKVVK